MIFGKVQGVDDVARQLNEELTKAALQELKDAVKYGAENIYDTARDNAPMATGELREAIKIKYSKKGLVAKIGVFGGDRGYIARFLEFGTKAHKIAPKNRKDLAFGGVFAKSVRHPGIAPRDWLLGPTKDDRLKFQAALRDAMIAALRSVSK